MDFFWFCATSSTMMLMLMLTLMDICTRTSCLKEILLSTKTSNWKDWSKSSSENPGWRHQSKPITGHLVYSICSTIEQSNTDYWLFSSPIQNIDQAKSVHIHLKFTIRDCQESIMLNKSRNCDNTFSLYSNLLSKYEHESNYHNTSRFQMISTVHAAYRWTKQDSRNTDLRMNSWQIDWPIYQMVFKDQVPKNILILAFRENSDCIVLHELEVSFKVCPEIQRGLVRIAKTSAGTNKIWSPGKVTCMQGASIVEEKEKVLQSNNLFCQPNGFWNTDVKESFCQCNAGFFRLNSSICAACPHTTFKSLAGDGFCQKCPENTQDSKYGQTFCECKSGFYRNLQKDLLSDPCTQPPSVPKDFYASYQTSFLVNLSWSYPTSTGGRDDISFHLVCANDHATVIRPKPLNQQRTAIVSRLKPSRSYLFQLYTLNGVSELAGMSWEVMRMLVVNTDPLDPPTNITWKPLPDNYSGILQWKIEKEIPKYFKNFVEIIVSFQIDHERKTWNTYHTRNSSMTINNLLPGIFYDIKTRIVLDGSTSAYSKELTVSVPGIMQNFLKNKVQSPKITSNISWILIGNLLIISFLLLVCLVFVIFYRRQKLSYSRLSKSCPIGTWNNEICLQRRLQHNTRKPFKNIKASNNSIYNILHSNSSVESPAILYRNKNISFRPWNLSYHQSELMFVDDTFEHYAGHLSMNNEDISVTISKSIQASDPATLNLVLSRLQLLTNIKCHYVVKLIGYNITNLRIVFIFEKVDKGNLEDYFTKSSETISKEDIQKILRNILSAFVCLFKMIIRLKTISLKCFWLSEDMTCKIQILLTNFNVENVAQINLRDFESSYIKTFNEIIILISERIAQNRDLTCLFSTLQNCCDQPDSTLSDIMTILD